MALLHFLRSALVSCVDATLFLITEAFFLAFAVLVLLLQVVSALLLPFDTSTTSAAPVSQEESPSSGDRLEIARSKLEAAKRAEELDKMKEMDEAKKEKEEQMKQLEMDRRIAEKLQEEFEKESREQAEKLMMVSQQGKAWKFVHAVIDLHKSFEQSLLLASGLTIAAITTVAMDDLVWLVERMIAKQEEYKASNICSLVDLGFHYTALENMKRIRTDGLLTLQERNALKIQAKHNGSSYGDGIYTSDDHKTHRHPNYGPICLLVARLKGTTANVVSADVTYVHGPMVVLRSSAQCVPLIQFTSADDAHFLHYKKHFQSLLDVYFNSGGQVVPMVANQDRSAQTWKLAAVAPIQAKPKAASKPQVIVTFAAQGLPGVAQIDKTIKYLAPDILIWNATDYITTIRAHSSLTTLDCSICLDPLKVYEAGQLVNCQHQFHYTCIRSALAHSSQCPLCKANIVEPQGKMPSAEMTVRVKPTVACDGFPSYGTIEIYYSIPSGVQKSYHNNPGSNFEGATRTAYVPDNSDGRRLLKRLEYAFSHGLTFTIGTSLTSGKANVVTWASIHHKTALSSAAHGFPDPGFFYNCNDELSSLGVPCADSL